jgi:hypothetical protein
MFYCHDHDDDEASYKVMQIVVETKEPHTIAGTFVIPASTIISEIMFSEKKSSKLRHPTFERYNNNWN